jgi:hypothetical protein
MSPITDFDPLKCLEDLQTGFLALEQNQRTLLDNQLKIQEQLKLIIGVQQSLQSRQDVIKQVLDLVIQAQKHTV